MDWWKIRKHTFPFVAQIWQSTRSAFRLDGLNDSSLVNFCKSSPNYSLEWNYRIKIHFLFIKLRKISIFICFWIYIYYTFLYLVLKLFFNVKSLFLVLFLGSIFMSFSSLSLFSIYFVDKKAVSFCLDFKITRLHHNQSPNCYFQSSQYDDFVDSLKLHLTHFVDELLCGSIN